MESVPDSAPVVCHWATLNSGFEHCCYLEVKFSVLLRVKMCHSAPSGDAATQQGFRLSLVFWQDALKQCRSRWFWRVGFTFELKWCYSSCPTEGHKIPSYIIFRFSSSKSDLSGPLRNNTLN